MIVIYKNDKYTNVYIMYDMLHEIVFHIWRTTAAVIFIVIDYRYHELAVSLTPQERPLPHNLVRSSFSPSSCWSNLTFSFFKIFPSSLHPSIHPLIVLSFPCRRTLPGVAVGGRLAPTVISGEGAGAPQVWRTDALGPRWLRRSGGLVVWALAGSAGRLPYCLSTETIS